MRLDGSLRRMQFKSNLFVELAADDQGKNFALSRRERGYERTQGAEPIMPDALCVGPPKCSLDGVQQSRFGYRLRQKVFRSSLGGSHARRNIAVAGQKDDRQRALPLGETAL